MKLVLLSQKPIRTTRLICLFIVWGTILLPPKSTAQETGSQASSINAQFSGEARVRLESWYNFGFIEDADDSFTLLRVLLGTNLAFGRRLRAFLQVRSSLTTQRDLPGGTREFDADDIAIHQAFVDLIFPLGPDAAFTARGVRRELKFGKQRLVSPIDWANTRRAFDGVDAILEVRGWNVHGFWARPVLIRENDFNKSDTNTDFLGVYATDTVTAYTLGFDVYWLLLDRDSAAFNGTFGRELRHSVGARVGGTVLGTGLSYDFEGTYQFGEAGDGKIAAFMVASEVAYSFERMATAPRVYLGFDFASGDDEPGGDVGTFNQLFTLDHAYLGFADVVGRQNIVALKAGLELRPVRTLTFGVAGHRFTLNTDQDAWYNALGGVTRPAAPGVSKDLAHELDLIVGYSFGNHLRGLIGFSHVVPDGFVRATGPSANLDFLYVSARATF